MDHHDSGKHMRVNPFSPHVLSEEAWKLLQRIADLLQPDEEGTAQAEAHEEFEHWCPRCGCEMPESHFPHGSADRLKW